MRINCHGIRDRSRVCEMSGFATQHRIARATEVMSLRGVHAIAQRVGDNRARYCMLLVNPA